MVTKGARSPIPIRQRWHDLRYMKDRTHQPPPVLLMFVPDGSFGSVQMWLGQAHLRLGIRAGDIALMMSGDVDPKNHEGQLALPLATVLERNFGIGYLPPCQLTPSAHTPMPDWARAAADDGG